MKLDRAPKVLLLVASLLAAVHIGLVVSVIALRIAFPFALEWMEGGTLEHALTGGGFLAGRLVSVLAWGATLALLFVATRRWSRLR